MTAPGQDLYEEWLRARDLPVHDMWARITQCDRDAWIAMERDMLVAELHRLLADVRDWINNTGDFLARPMDLLARLDEAIRETEPPACVCAAALMVGHPHEAGCPHAAIASDERPA